MTLLKANGHTRKWWSTWLGMKLTSRVVFVFLALLAVSYGREQRKKMILQQVWSGRALLSVEENSTGITTFNVSCPGLRSLDLDWSSLSDLGLSYAELEEKCDVEELEYLKSLDLSSSDGNHSVVWEECDFEKSHHPILFLFIHIVFIITLFVGLAIICDDFFVPSLEAISEKLNLSQDVAGATFMAAGSSAPELFTSIAAVGITSDVGVGTIVGSAAFNILIIIALTALLAGQVLNLDWRPMFRDAVFYGVSICFFIIFAWDGLVQHYEAALLLVLYILYVISMKFNKKLMACLGKLTNTVNSQLDSKVGEEDKDKLQTPGDSERRHAVELQQRGTTQQLTVAEIHQNRFLHLRGGELSGSFANHRPSIAQQPVFMKSKSAVEPSTQESAPVHQAKNPATSSTSHCPVSEGHSPYRLSPLQPSNWLNSSAPYTVNGHVPNTLPPIHVTPAASEQSTEIFPMKKEDDVSVTRAVSITSLSNASNSGLEQTDEKEEEETLKPCPCLPAINTQFPSCDDLKSAPSKAMFFLQLLRFIGKWIFFAMAILFVCAFTWTVPPCKKPQHRKYFVVSFVMSIVWIAMLSFATVVLVARVGCILGIDSYTMGLVVIAVGTSVPDAITSILVGRDGFSDMAVSNAIGSNVFDINLGLGLPYLIKTIIKSGQPVLLLTPVELVAFRFGFYELVPHAKFGFILLLILIFAILLFMFVNFQLNRTVAVCLIVLYGLFLFYAFWQDIKCYKGRTC